MSGRTFRTSESYDAERLTRDMLKEFLQSRGFRDVQDERKSYGKSESQTLYAKTSAGDRLAMRVRLCWRRVNRRSKKPTKSAAQLLSKVRNDDWEGTLRAKVERERAEGATHYLIVQRDGDFIIYAALVPLLELVTIWCAQRDISISLIAQGKLGRRHKNHAMNGSSPTIWLQDEQAPDVAAALWDHADVQDLARLTVHRVGFQNVGTDDTFDDMPIADYSLIGSDGAPTVLSIKSHVKRDQRVRAAVLDRAKGKCERAQCGAARSYPGFLDVHHIFGAEKSDRVRNCVALCPNCHREAHYAPDREKINAELLVLTKGFLG
jgi:5-methylcytosine-specific restriction enzyme A